MIPLGYFLRGASEVLAIADGAFALSRSLISSAIVYDLYILTTINQWKKKPNIEAL